MSCNGKCQECNTNTGREPKELSFEDIIKALSDRVSGDGIIERVKEVEEIDCNDKLFVQTAIDNCVKRDIEKALITVSPEHLTSMVWHNHHLLTMAEEGVFTVKEGVSHNVQLSIEGSPELSYVEVRVLDLASINSGGNIESLVNHIMSETNEFAGMRISAQTLDHVIEIMLSKHGKKVVVAGDKILIPMSSGFKIARVDNDLEFGRIKYTNNI